jgi:hypothetical protein
MTPDRSSTRRAIARRFSCANDPRWERLMRALAGAGLAAVMAAVIVQLVDFPDEWAGEVGLAAMAGVVALAMLGWLLPTRSAVAEVLRFDGALWWWERAGEPLAVVPEVFIDTEHWMLVRLRARDEEGRPLGHRARGWLALSRRGLGSTWTSLRLHLFLA